MTRIAESLEATVAQLFEAPATRVVKVGRPKRKRAEE